MKLNSNVVKWSLFIVALGGVHYSYKKYYRPMVYRANVNDVSDLADSLYGKVDESKE